MRTYEFYKVIHLAGMFLLFAVIGGVAVYAANGGTKADNPARKLLAALHGTALFVVLLGGFGALARLGMAQGGLPGWIYAKLAIWFVMAAALTAAYKLPQFAKAFLVVFPLLGALAGYIAIYKPF